MENIQQQDNPQWGEIEAIQATYRPSAKLSERKTKLLVARKELIEMHKRGEIPAENLYDNPRGIGPEILPTMPFELDMMENAEEGEAYDDRQAWLRENLRFRDSNLFFELDKANEGQQLRSFAMKRHIDPSLTDEQAAEDIADWIAYLKSVKQLFIGHTWAEMIGSDLGGTLSEPLEKIMEYGLIGVSRAEARHTHYCQIRIWIGKPYSQWACLL